MIYWIAFQGFLRYNLRADRVHLRHDIQNSPAKIYSKTTVAKDGHSEVITDILTQIEVKELYLNPNLSLETCANTLNISPSHLSKIINAQPHQNFSELINEYRVRYATELLKNPEFNHYTILSIGLESGFNSKSTFYTAFKKLITLTPVAYKKKHQVH